MRQTQSDSRTRASQRPSEVTYIRTPAALATFCEELAREPAFALDLEFRRERTYRAKLELAQIASSRGPAIVDPLALKDITPLFRLVADPSIEKVVHAGSQDMEIVYSLTRTPPKRVFDTQIAAGLLGYGDQIGYADLLHRVLGVRLSKLETRTDWSRRPLSAAQVAYALDDVRYLLELRERLGRSLEDKGRVAWLAEELAHYEVAATYEVDAMRLALRLPRVRSLSRRTLAVLLALVEWREEEAAARDEPRGFIVSDSLLVEIARRAPHAPEDLGALRGLHPRLVERAGRAIVAAVKKGAAVPEDALPEQLPGRSDDPGRAVTLDLLEVFVRHRALEAEVAPRYLGTRQDIADLMDVHLSRGNGSRRAANTAAPEAGSRAGEPQVPLLSGFRYDLIGRDVLAILDGRLDLGVDARTGAVAVRERAN